MVTLSFNHIQGKNGSHWSLILLSFMQFSDFYKHYLKNNSVLYYVHHQSKRARFQHILTNFQLKKSNDYSSLFSTVFLALEYNPEADNPNIPPTNIPCFKSKSAT